MEWVCHIVFQCVLWISNSYFKFLRFLTAHTINKSDFFITGDFCCNPLSLGRVKSVIEDSVPGIYVKSLKIGSSVVEASILSLIFGML
jgi:hypothetical protein